LVDDTILLRTTAAGRCYYLSRTARPVVRTGGSYAMSLVRDPEGGTLGVQVALVALAPAPDDEKRWRAALPPSDWSFEPLPWWSARMTASLGATETDVGAPGAVPVIVVLSPGEADDCWTALGAGSGPSVALRFDLHYDFLLPECAYVITAAPEPVRAALARHPAAVSAFYGTAGTQADIDRMLAELRDVVDLSWHGGPGNEAAETAIRWRWVKRVLDELVERVEPGDGGDLGAVAARLTERDVSRLDLTERHDGGAVGVATLSRGLDLSAMRGIGRSEYATDLTGDREESAVLLDFAPDARVEAYRCQYGYRRADGSVFSAAYEAGGTEGLRVTDTVAWGAGPRPEAVEVHYVVRWAAPGWQSVDGTATLPARRSCLTFTLNPGRHVAEVVVVDDLSLADPGVLAVVEWTVGTPGKSYGDGFVVEGAGPDGGIQRRSVVFPCPPGIEAGVVFAWQADLILPDGTVRHGQDRFTLAESTRADVRLSSLFPPSALRGDPARPA